MASKIYLRIFTNKSCSLCDTAKEALKRINKQVAFSLEEIDIHAKGNEPWFQKYCFDVPVVHVSKDSSEVKDRKEDILAMHRIDEPLVTKKLMDLIKSEK
ncbi:hypothetical protein DSO57_1014889 [Entomophthora muscae]|uniref:Uncharacterized protein n=2 Tax=Entomophthora muscae TaxID=34485 RepID=A0ACC2SI19_9FUNG|nr:hypothetical protein DSO57_1031124 [Entomophthora muscae]KAJ9062034.1 hypothetical protein DSO57_1014889 [Entomophthora muscae]